MKKLRAKFIDVLETEQINVIYCGLGGADFTVLFQEPLTAFIMIQHFTQNNCIHQTANRDCSLWPDPAAAVDAARYMPVKL